MLANVSELTHINRRVRAILLTGDSSVLLIKRVKSPRHRPYWVAPGGGIESGDSDLVASLERELYEELGAVAQVIDTAFVLEHQKAGKQLEEHFFVCLLEQYDLSKRSGPEFADPRRGEYIPEEIPLTVSGLRSVNIKTPEMRDWMLDHLDYLKSYF